MAQCDIKGVIAFQKLLYVMHCKKGDFNAGFQYYYRELICIMTHNHKKVEMKNQNCSTGLPNQNEYYIFVLTFMLCYVYKSHDIVIPRSFCSELINMQNEEKKSCQEFFYKIILSKYCYV